MERDTKRCSVCGETRALTDFYAASGTRDGLRGDCKVCFAARAAKRYREDPEKVKARVRQWQQENRERYRESQRRIKQSPEGRRREREGHLRRKYGITQADYDALLIEQGGGCAICGRKPSKISLHVDHEHGSNAVRGILCFRCNNALGDLGDSPAQLQRAVAYLTRDPELDALVRARVERELLGQQ